MYFLCTPVHSYFHFLFHSCLHSVSSFMNAWRCNDTWLTELPWSLCERTYVNSHLLVLLQLWRYKGNRILGKGKSLGNLLSPPLVKGESPMSLFWVFWNVSVHSGLYWWPAGHVKLKAMVSGCWKVSFVYLYVIYFVLFRKQPLVSISASKVFI